MNKNGIFKAHSPNINNLPSILHLHRSRKLFLVFFSVLLLIWNYTSQDCCEWIKMLTLLLSVYKAPVIPKRREQRHIKNFHSEMYRSNSHLWIQKSIDSSLNYLPLLPRGPTTGHLTSSSTATIIKMTNDRFSHSCWSQVIPNPKTSLDFPVQLNCTDWRDSLKTAIISMQDSWLLEKKCHSLFFCSSSLNSSTTQQNRAVSINNILMEKNLQSLFGQFPLHGFWECFPRLST